MHELDPGVEEWFNGLDMPHTVAVMKFVMDIMKDADGDICPACALNFAFKIYNQFKSEWEPRREMAKAAQYN